MRKQSCEYEVWAEVSTHCCSPDKPPGLGCSLRSNKLMHWGEARSDHAGPRPSGGGNRRGHFGKDPCETSGPTAVRAKSSRGEYAKRSGGEEGI